MRFLVAQVYELARELNGAAGSIAAKLQEDGASDVLIPFSTDLLEDTVKLYARYAALEFQPLCAMFGGIVAQEVLKFTGKYTPIDGWFFHDCFEALPSPLPAAEDVAPTGTRYDNTIQIFGKALQVCACVTAVAFATDLRLWGVAGESIGDHMMLENAASRR